MNDDDGFPERLGKKVNELDIDFSRFTAAGWVVVVATLGAGGLAGWLISQNVPMRNAMDKGPALLIGVGGLTAAITTFFVARWVLRQLGIKMTRD